MSKLIIIIVIFILGNTACATCPASIAAERYGSVLECSPDKQNINGYLTRGMSCRVLTPKGSKVIFIQGCQE